MKAPKIDFSDLPDDVHRCIGEIIGEWAVFHCPLCPGYERRINLFTGKMYVNGKTEFHHVGSTSNANNAEALLAMSGPN